MSVLLPIFCLCDRANFYPFWFFSYKIHTSHKRFLFWISLRWTDVLSVAIFFLRWINVLLDFITIQPRPAFTQLHRKRALRFNHNKEKLQWGKYRGCQSWPPSNSCLFLDLDSKVRTITCIFLPGKGLFTLVVHLTGGEEVLCHLLTPVPLCCKCGNCKWLGAVTVRPHSSE